MERTYAQNYKRILNRNETKQNKQSILNAVRCIRSAKHSKISKSTAKQHQQQKNNRQLFLPTQQPIPRETYSIIGTVRQPVSQSVSQLVSQQLNYFLYKTILKLLH